MARSRNKNNINFNMYVGIEVFVAGKRATFLGELSVSSHQS
jgi:hypothetical protein